jgi:hypothetical protein
MEARLQNIRRQLFLNLWNLRRGNNNTPVAVFRVFLVAIFAMK